MLQHILVCGINDERMQKRLLIEVNLMFGSALKISQGVEVAVKCASEQAHKQLVWTADQQQQIYAVINSRPQPRKSLETEKPIYR